MKQFLAVYLGNEASFNASGWNALSEDARKKREQEGMQAWGKWVETHKAAIIDTGAPLGKTLRVSKDGIESTRNNLTGYTVVRADSQESAARMFEGHPHFTIFPGDSIEIVECLPMPG
ncbi:hypothetical protein [Dyella jiangningensis]|uniref:YCII-related domain-containing protein n=1 Tax=Dyella jiangningensis TaxID=1379159 RepID=A0A328P1K0_9GAMM|nr:hypothetical protein [Dyella jiangningensis]RAO75879.1 hypothetical protein CA260_17780 [Dyella jiangningensis]